MTLTLRPYQDRLIADARTALRTSRSVLVVLPTGGGKTALSSRMAKTVADKNRTAMFIVHRVELIEQTMRTFDQFGIPHGVIAAGYAPSPYQPIQIASIDTLRARLRSGRIPINPALCIWDEAHHTAAASWSAVKAQFASALHVGLTATPERLDGKGLRAHYDTMVCGPTTAQLIEQGYLCRYRAFAPQAPDLGGVHTLAGDYRRDENEGAMDKPTITGDAIGHYLRLARDKRALAFCVSIKHSQHVAQQFREAGVVAWHLDGGTDRGERQQAVEAFRRGKIKVLCNVELFGEGFDVPAADASILLRPTKSLGLYLQQVGRVLRPQPGKTALILDHAGNMTRHGFPDDDREWSLDGRDKKARDSDTGPAMRRCPACFHVHRPAPCCSGCGHVYEAEGRAIEQVAGELAEVDIEAMRLRRKQEERRAASIDDLIEIGRQRGYKSPERWAAHYFTARQEKRRGRG